LPDGEQRVDYEDFKKVVRENGERRVAQGGLVPIPELRRQCPSLDPQAFDAFVLTLHREGAVHLLSHVESDRLSEAIREQCVVHPTGTLLYWLRWL
jgi:hypothetical protein